MERVSTDLKRLYFHDGGLSTIYHDPNTLEFFFEIELPEEIEDLGIEYGDSRCGLLTFYGVNKSSITPETDYLKLNHPKLLIQILSCDYMSEIDSGMKDTVKFWFHAVGEHSIGEGISVQFSAEGFTWSPYKSCEHS